MIFKKILPVVPLLISVFYVMNNGGVGLALPINIFFWGLMAMSTLVLWLKVSRRPVVTLTAIYFIAGVSVLCIPLFFTRAEWLSHAEWRIAALISGGIFYFSWLQVRLSHSQRQWVFYALLLAVGGQAVLALLQLFAPDWAWVSLRGSRVYGVFQQANVLASFIATGLALALMLFLLPGFTLAHVRHEHIRRGLLGVVLLVLPALLVWINSRAGWLGGLLVVVLFLWCFGARFPARCKSAAALMIAGALSGLGGMLLSGEGGVLRHISHSGSNQARWTMLLDTLRMIALKPLQGWGYGGFEYSFMHFRINQAPPRVVTEIARHPHNEILLWWVEGGVVALLGIGLIIAGLIYLLRRARRWDQQAFARGSRSAGEPTALCIVLLPITLHTQLEYPFYMSVFHFLVFLLLLAMLDRQVSSVMDRRPIPRPAGLALRGGLPVLAAGVLVVMVFALLGGGALTRAERIGLVDMREVESMAPLAAWVHQERKTFDQQVNALLRYNQARDDMLLENYALWAEQYLSRRVDANVYASLIQILQYQEQAVLAGQYRRDAHLLFPTDMRFQAGTVIRKQPGESNP